MGQKSKIIIIAIILAVIVGIIMAIWSKNQQENQDQTKTESTKENQEQNQDNSQLNLLNLHYSIRNHSLISTSATAMLMLTALAIIYCQLKKRKQRRQQEFMQLAALSQQVPPYYPHGTVLTGTEGAVGTADYFSTHTSSTKPDRQNFREANMHMASSTRNSDFTQNNTDPILQPISLGKKNSLWQARMALLAVKLNFKTRF